MDIIVVNKLSYKNLDIIFSGFIIMMINIVIMVIIIKTLKQNIIFILGK